MNWNLITRDKSGEIRVSFTLVCLIVILVGFLFGLGFSLAYSLVDSIFYNNEWFVYVFLKEHFQTILLSISSSALGLFIAYILVSYLREKREDKKNEKR